MAAGPNLTVRGGTDREAVHHGRMWPDIHKILDRVADYRNRVTQASRSTLGKRRNVRRSPNQETPTS